MSTTPQIRYHREQLWLGLALLVAILTVYSQVGSFAFNTYDDPVYVTENVMVQQGLSREGLAWAFGGVRGGAWMPLTWLSHMLDCQLFGLKAGGHHLVNVLYHIVNTILLFLILGRLTGEVWKSVMVAALFALHPLRVESVAWVAERRDVLSTLWGLLAILAYAAWVEKQGTFRYLALLLAFVAGLAAKPMLVTLPLLLLLLDIWPLRRIKTDGLVDLWRQKKTVLALLYEKIPLFLLVPIFAAITLFAEGQGGALGSLAVYPLAYRVSNALLAYVRYLGMTFWPVDLLPFYPFPKTISPWLAGVALFILGLITVAVLRNLKARPYLLVGWFWFLGTMLPVIGLIQQGSGFALADRYTYVPLIGVFIMVVWGGTALLERYGFPPLWMRLLSVGILAVLMILAFRQVGHWRNTTALFSYTLAVDPENKIALSQLGVQAREQGKYIEAYKDLSKAVLLYPDDFEAQGNLAKLLWLMGRTGEALRHYSEAMRLNPKNTAPYVDSGIIKAEQGDFAGALAYLRMAGALRPDDLGIHLNLALVLDRQGNYDEALRVFSTIIQANPGFAQAHNGMGVVYLETGRVGEAIDSFRTALRIDPGLQPARDNLALALRRQDGADR